jgi:hypothetical protein
MFISNLNYLESVGQEKSVMGGGSVPCYHCNYKPEYPKKHKYTPKKAYAFGGLEAFANGNNVTTLGNVFMDADSVDGSSTTIILGFASAES